MPKHYFLNHYNEIPLYSKEINNLKFYIQFIINNYFEDKVILKNDKCNLFINTGKLNNTKDQSFYNFTEKLFFKEDIIKPIQEKQFYKHIFELYSKIHNI